MVKRFEWPEATASTVRKNADEAVRQIKDQGSRVLGSLETLVTERPMVVLSIAIFTGVAVGWWIKRR